MELYCHIVSLVLTLFFLLGNLQNYSVADEFDQEIDRSDWVDPTDMLNYDTGTKRNIKSPSKDKLKYSSGYDSTQDSPVDCNCKKFEDNLLKCSTELENIQHEQQACQHMKPDGSNTDTIYFKQYINTLLNKFSDQANIELGDGQTVRFNMEILLNHEDIKTLKRVGDSKREGTGITDAHLILVNSIHSVEESFLDTLTFAEKWKLNSILENMDIILKILVTILVAYSILRIHLSLNVSFIGMFTILFLALFLLSVALTWSKLHQEAEAERIVTGLKGMPESCNPKDFTVQRSFFESIKSMFTYDSDECATYYKKMTVDPFTEVPPTKALAVTITTFILEPVEHIGGAISKFIKAVFQPLPLHIQLPVGIVLIFFLTLVTLMTFGYKMNLFYFFGIEPSHNSGDVKRIRDMEKKMEALQERLDREKTSGSIESKRVIQPEQVGACSLAPQTPVHSLTASIAATTHTEIGSGDSQHVSKDRGDEQHVNKDRKNSNQTQTNVDSDIHKTTEQGSYVKQCSEGKGEDSTDISEKDIDIQATSIGPT